MALEEGGESLATPQFVVGGFFRSTREVIQLAEQLEQNGNAGIFCGDSQSLTVDRFVALAAASTVA